MSELGNRTGALLPTLMESWEHGNLNGRRLLPSPGPKKVSEFYIKNSMKISYKFYFFNKLTRNLDIKLFFDTSNFIT